MFFAPFQKLFCHAHLSNYAYVSWMSFEMQYVLNFEYSETNATWSHKTEWFKCCFIVCELQAKVRCTAIWDWLLLKPRKVVLLMPLPSFPGFYVNSRPIVVLPGILGRDKHCRHPLGLCCMLNKVKRVRNITHILFNDL